MPRSLLNGYTIALVLTFVAVMAAVALVNFRVDSKGVFGTSLASYSGLVERLTRSTHGLTITEGNIRYVKLALIRQSTSDCYVSGSSRTMEFASDNWPAARAYGCASLTNIGVYYSAYEDALIQIAALLENERFRTLFLAMDPWIFRKKKTRRFEAMAKIHLAARRRFGLPLKGYRGKVERVSVYREIVNFSYFVRNVRVLLAGEASAKVSAVSQAEKVDETKPPKREIFRHDGSRIRGLGSYNKLVRRGRYFDAGNIKPPFVSPDVVEEFKVVLARAARADKRVAFLLTPYSPEVWECNGANARTCAGLRDVERQILDLAREFKIDVFGSFNPEAAGVTSEDFLDGYHMRPTAFAKIGLTVRNTPGQPPEAR